MIVSHFSYFIILLLVGGDVIETLGGHKTPVLKVVLCTCFTDPRFIAFIHFGPFYMFVRFAVHLYICYFVKVSNQNHISHFANCLFISILIFGCDSSHIHCALVESAKCKNQFVAGVDCCVLIRYDIDSSRRELLAWEKQFWEKIAMFSMYFDTSI